MGSTHQPESLLARGPLAIEWYDNFSPVSSDTGLYQAVTIEILIVIDLYRVVVYRYTKCQYAWYNSVRIVSIVDRDTNTTVHNNCMLTTVFYCYQMNKNRTGGGTTIPKVGDRSREGDLFPVKTIDEYAELTRHDGKNNGEDEDEEEEAEDEEEGEDKEVDSFVVEDEEKDWNEDEAKM
ncbi:hypothetical protein B296_00002633 [Ensete ventricosum]|uniref:Uncharacterized protein n=1 Tax=Ensete ventricosum TaxID=4639 RepID=A0A427B9K9_ENSVE|nr:hypothetical protein B296_00002633 [Ensete ventricosum]